MAHHLILGVTEFGKTTLARQMSYAYQNAGYTVLVLDRFERKWEPDKWGPVDSCFVTTHADELREWVFNSHGCMVFVDECEATLDFNREYSDIATLSRQWGHCVHFIAQRHIQLIPTMRNMCTHLHFFRLGDLDARDMGREYADRDLVQACTLRAGEYVSKSGLANPVRRKRLW